MKGSKTTDPWVFYTGAGLVILLWLIYIGGKLGLIALFVR